MSAIKVIRVLGTSDESWEDAAEEALRQATQTIDDIHGVKIESWTGDVEDGEITEYRATVELSFPVHEDQGV